MSDLQLKSEVAMLVRKSGYSKSKSLICPIAKILSMRHKDISFRRIYKITKSTI